MPSARAGGSGRRRAAGGARLVGLLDVAEQPDEALVNDLLGEHLLSVELADEAEVAERPLLRADADQLLLLLGRVLSQRLLPMSDHILLLKLLLAPVHSSRCEETPFTADVNPPASSWHLLSRRRLNVTGCPLASWNSGKDSEQRTESVAHLINNDEQLIVN